MFQTNNFIKRKNNPQHAIIKMRAKMRAISYFYLSNIKHQYFYKHLITNALCTTHKQQNTIRGFLLVHQVR